MRISVEVEREPGGRGWRASAMEVAPASQRALAYATERYADTPEVAARDAVAVVVARVLACSCASSVDPACPRHGRR